MDIYLVCNLNIKYFSKKNEPNIGKESYKISGVTFLNTKMT
jgi:hypothetical protein